MLRLRASLLACVASALQNSPRPSRTKIELRAAKVGTGSYDAAPDAVREPLTDVPQPLDARFEYELRFDGGCRTRPAWEARKTEL